MSCEQKIISITEVLWTLKHVVQMTKLTGELNVNEADSKGYTPLHFAVATRKVTELEFVRSKTDLPFLFFFLNF